MNENDSKIVKGQNHTFYLPPWFVSEFQKMLNDYFGGNKSEMILLALMSLHDFIEAWGRPYLSKDFLKDKYMDKDSEIYKVKYPKIDYRKLKSGSFKATT